MSLFDLVEKRRSCRKFLDKPVERHLIDKILKATLTAPSSKHTRTSRFAVVEDRKIVEALSIMRSTGCAFIKDAPLVIVVMSEPVEDAILIENSSISATFIQLLAEQAGLGSCWVQVRDRLRNNEHPDLGTAEEYVKELMPQLAHYHIECIIALGYGAEPAKPRKEYDDSDKVIFIG